MSSPINDYTIFGIEIISVAICTADVLNGNTISSCSDTEADLSTNYDAIADNLFNLLTTDTTNTFQNFELTIPVLADDIFFVEVVVELTLNNNRRRRFQLLQNDNTVNKYQSTITLANLKDKSNNNGSSKSNSNNLSTGSIVGISTGAFILFAIIIGGATYFSINFIKMKKAINEKEIIQVVEN